MLTELSASKKSMCLLLEYCKDINEWANRWAIDKADIQIGRAITEYCKCFLIDRIEKERAKSTVKIYARYLWALGGELIRCLHENDSDRQLSAKDLILKYTDSSGGIYWRHARDDFEHRRYDSVCKQLFKFVVNISPDI